MPTSTRGARPRTFYETVTDAVADITAHGFDTQERLDYWTTEIRRAAEREMTPAPVLEQELNRVLRTTYERLVGRAAILQRHPGVSRFTLDRVAPRLRRELDRRIMASAQLIKLNRAASIDTTLRRFAGWTTSIPAGGSDVVDRNYVKANVGKALKSLPFEVRRCVVDQNAKLISSINSVLAEDSGAIAGVWHSHFRQKGYDARVTHKERDSKIYVIRDGWAYKKGLITKGAGFTDEMTQPAEEVFCRCYYQYFYSLNDLPSDMLTAKGKDVLTKAKEQAKLTVAA